MWVIIQHVSYDGRGGIGPALARAGLEAVDRRPFAAEQLPAVSELSGLIVLGAPAGTADAAAPEHLVSERQLIRHAVDRGIPVLGVCFGARLLAVALGGSVVTDGRLEIGMGSATLTETGRADPVLDTDGDTVQVLHWHRDAYTLLPGAVRLATSGHDVEQAFRFGEKVYGLQFHVEINPSWRTSSPIRCRPALCRPMRSARRHSGAAACWTGFSPSVDDDALVATRESARRRTGRKIVAARSVPRTLRAEAAAGAGGNVEAPQFS